MKNDVKLYNELTETEKIETITKAVFSARKAIESKSQNIQVVEEMYTSDNIQEMIAECYIQNEKRSEKYPEKDSFLLSYGSAMIAYYKILDEKLGKRTYVKDDNTGKYKTSGRRINKAAAIDKIQYAYDENEYNKTEKYIDIMNACSNDRQKEIIEYRILGFNNQEIANYYNVTRRTIDNEIRRVKENM